MNAQQVAAVVSCIWGRFPHHYVSGWLERWTQRVAGLIQCVLALINLPPARWAWFNQCVKECQSGLHCLLPCGLERAYPSNLPSHRVFRGHNEKGESFSNTWRVAMGLASTNNILEVIQGLVRRHLANPKGSRYRRL